MNAYDAGVAPHVDDGNHGEIRLSGVLRIGAQTTGEERRGKCLCGLGGDMVMKVFPAGQCLIVAHCQRLGSG